MSKLQPHQKLQRLADKAQDESRARWGLLGYVTILALALMAVSVSGGVLADMLNFFIYGITGFINALFRERANDVYKILVIIVVAYLYHNWHMAKKADDRHKFFSDND